MQPEEVMMQAYAKPKKEGNKFGLVIAMGIMLFIAAIAGVIFGVYEMMAKNSEVEAVKAECEKSIEEAKGTGCGEAVVDSSISKTLVRSLIDPYVIPLSYYSNIFNYDFDENVKAVIAYKNIDSEVVGQTARGGSPQISYSDLNNKYKEMFSGTNSLSRSDFTVNKYVIKYNEEGSPAQQFVVTNNNGSGTGLSMIDVVKSAKYDDDGNVIIDMYHDVVSTCATKAKQTVVQIEPIGDEPEEEEEEEKDGREAADYCVETDANDTIVRSVSEYNMKILIEKFEKDIPQFRMKFVEQNGHYVLSSVSKI